MQIRKVAFSQSERNDLSFVAQPSIKYTNVKFSSSTKSSYVVFEFLTKFLGRFCLCWQFFLPQSRSEVFIK